MVVVVLVSSTFDRLGIPLAPGEPPAFKASTRPLPGRQRSAPPSRASPSIRSSPRAHSTLMPQPSPRMLGARFQSSHPRLVSPSRLASSSSARLQRPTFWPRGLSNVTGQNDRPVKMTGPIEMFSTHACPSATQLVWLAPPCRGTLPTRGESTPTPRAFPMPSLSLTPYFYEWRISYFDGVDRSDR